MQNCYNPNCSSPRAKCLSKAHDFLCAKSKHYHNWHHNSHHQKVHFVVLGLYSLLVVALVTSTVLQGGRSVRASGSTAAVVGSTAVAEHTSEKIYFDASPYGSNVTIDNETREMDGYAWSEDLGWISFGSTSNPSGPVTADAVGYLSGKAKVLSGGYIDFNASPSGSNVAIDGSGNFSGYAWSEDLGWISFTGVSTPTYITDLLPPPNPSPITAKNTSGGSATLTSDNWYNYPAPYLSWTAPTDIIAEGGGTPSGTAGYWIVLDERTNNSTDDQVDPYSTGDTSLHYQTGTNFTASGLTTGHAYDLRVRTKDSAGNKSDPETLFTYKYDATAPTNPAFVSVSPTGYTSTNSYTFIWPGSGSSMAGDPGYPTTGSGVAGYQYKTGASSGKYSDWSNTVTETSLTLPDSAYQEGANTFYLRTVDVAGNASNPITATFYYAGSAPSAPQNITATPATSVSDQATTNSFTFNWETPASYNGSIKQYRYSINALPTTNNTTLTAQTSLSASAYATQQGKNTLYVVAEDEAGNINYNVYASVDFYATTPAPGIPTGVQAIDVSNRDAALYSVTLKWIEPISKGTGFSGYSIERSIDNLIFNEIATTSGASFVDDNLQSIPYFYHIKSKDNAGQYSVSSSTVSITPTGKYTSPPRLTEDPVSTPKAFSASIAWETDREGSSIIKFGKSKDNLLDETSKATELVKKHAVDIKGLDPETVYYYQTIWIDSDGNQGKSDVLSFTTGLRPKISDVKISGITLSEATVSWTSTTIATSTIAYGKTTGYGGTVSDKSNSQTTNHTIALSNLDHSSTYHFQITGTDTDGNTLTSDDYAFNTLIKPVISNLRFESVKDAATSSLRFSWKTNVPTTSIVAYTSAPSAAGQAGSAAASSQSKADYVMEHDIVVKDLMDQTTYTLYAKGVDQYGNTAESDKNVFTTPDDTRAPRVKNVTIEVKSNGFGDTQKAQLVVGWETDEPATSQIEFGPGISGKEYPNRSKEDQALTTSHVVIVSELEPSKIYHLRTVSKDRAGNSGMSEDTTVITGKIQKSVIDIIINSLERSLGWMFGIFGTR